MPSVEHGRFDTSVQQVCASSTAEQVYALYVQSTHCERLSVQRFSAELQRLLVGRGRIRVCVCFVAAMCTSAHGENRVRVHRRGALQAQCVDRPRTS